ncbi:hypothetical protein AGLY_001601 [Aphis glycines]|uniref:Uncharacterized protein n=1 Tax=Aphis glycines TaxID=307491 RepID=A0A6G0U813_APHGL|nr:hypothetical protein AGLY_001601 [Aphis glycines]
MVEHRILDFCFLFITTTRHKLFGSSMLNWPFDIVIETCEERDLTHVFYMSMCCRMAKRQAYDRCTYNTLCKCVNVKNLVDIATQSAIIVSSIFAPKGAMMLLTIDSTSQSITCWEINKHLSKYQFFTHKYLPFDSMLILSNLKANITKLNLLCANLFISIIKCLQRELKDVPHSIQQHSKKKNAF